MKFCIYFKTIAHIFFRHSSNYINNKKWAIFQTILFPEAKIYTDTLKTWSKLSYQIVLLSFSTVLKFILNF